MPFIIIILFIIICILSVLLAKKKAKDDKELEEYQQQLQEIKHECEKVSQTCDFQLQRTQEAEKKYNEIIQQYKTTTAQNQEDLDNFFLQQRNFRQSELDTEFEEKRRKYEENLQLNFSLKEKEYNSKLDTVKEQVEENIAAAKNNEAAIIAEVQYQQNRFDGLLMALQQYDKELQEKLFYTIQIPDEYKSDIDFLLNEVSQKVQHPDIINKLVWAEYVKKYIEDTFKRIQIKEDAGIYKITNIKNGKAYIGKSTNVKKRIIDHFKSSVGIKTIADQAIHHAILEDGIWNWTIEIITYCDKDNLNDLEKYYIDFFKTQNFGYNKNAGGGG